MGARSRIYCPGSFCRSLVPRARVPVVQHLQPARAHRASHSQTRAAISALKSIGQVLYLEMNPYFFLNLYLSQRGKGFPCSRGSSLCFWQCCFHSFLMGQIPTGSRCFFYPSLWDQTLSLSMQWIWGAPAQSAAVLADPAPSGHGPPGLPSTHADSERDMWEAEQWWTGMFLLLISTPFFFSFFFW